jgi:hypothetical protein
MEALLFCEAQSEIYTHCRGPGSKEGQYVRDLWMTKWHWDRFFSEYFSSQLGSHHKCPVTIIILTVLLSEGKADEA